jgi:glucokinase
MSHTLNDNVMGVDIGGTKIAAGRVRFDGGQITIDGALVTETRASQGLEVSLAQLWSVMERTVTKDVQAIGICAPGPLHQSTGVILNPPNLPGWSDVPLCEMAANKFGLPVKLENDCNAAALAEARYGAGRGHSVVFYAAIGTGIGSGIVIDGKVFQGANGSAGEAGHITIDYQSPVVCGCGAPGCIEGLASGSAIARSGDHESAELADRLGAQLSAWLASIVSLLDPGIVVLGGGVMNGALGQALFTRLRQNVPRLTVNPYAGGTQIMPAYFGEQAGIVGAAALFEAEVTKR